MKYMFRRIKNIAIALVAVAVIFALFYAILTVAATVDIVENIIIVGAAMSVVFTAVIAVIATGFVLFAIVYVFRKLVGENIIKRIVPFQNELILKHCEEVEYIYEQMRGWRHDYHNHIQTMKAFIASGDTAEHLEYLNKLDKDLTEVDTMTKTGNVMADAILNSKLSLAAAKDIKVTVDMSDMSLFSRFSKISQVDLCVLIGNILDNAIEACMKLPRDNGRFIDMSIDRHKSMIYISVENSCLGDIEIKKIGNRYISSKNDAQAHGFGLMRIDKIAAKYGGFVNLKNEQGVFSTEIMFPI